MPEQTSRHTATPWSVITGSIYGGSPDLDEVADGYATRIAFMDRDEPDTCPVERDANAHYIVRAVNAHADLLAAAEAAVSFLMSKARRDPYEIDVVRDLADAAKKARGAVLEQQEGMQP